MNKQQATQNGYYFHGAYSHNKNEIKAKAKELRDLGNKAIVVNVPHDKLSRGYGGMGYSVYWIQSEENIAAETKKDKENKIRYLAHEKIKCENRIKEIELEIVSLA